ncbi:MAG: hypothetical protein Q8K55_07190 [Gemmatimonadaceae bacterium]|nr:hypothetical protein [Gemmatimonadaceae bacterium]
MTVRAPVALIAFNRPSTTARVFARIREARPSRLFIALDGPRPDRPGEAELCAEVKRIVSEVDWPCEVERSYSDANLGCCHRPASAIEWVFSRAEEAIFLEDDILPEPTFFRYCDELLERYRDEPRVMSISGYNAFGESLGTADSYWYSLYPRSWGWAGWRRAWNGYDVQMRGWPAFRSSAAWRKLPAETHEVYGHWMDNVHAGRVDVWDAQWLLLAWQTGGVTAIPRRNLIENLGFGAGSTNTPNVPPLYPARSWPMQFPLAHPPTVARDRAQEVEWIRREHDVRGTTAGRAVHRFLHHLKRRLLDVISPRVS